MEMMTNRIMRARPPTTPVSAPAEFSSGSPQAAALGPARCRYRVAWAPLPRTTVPGSRRARQSDRVSDPDGPTGAALATSTASGGSTNLTFADRSTMTLAGIADITR